MHNQQLYQAVVGSQLYLSTKTRPVIAYTVSCVARFCAKPSKEHWTGVKRILRYLKGTNKLRAHLQRRYSSCNHWILRCRLGWRCWRQKINLWVRVPSGRCCYQLEEQQTDLCGSIDCRGRVRFTGRCSPRRDLASATYGRPVKREHPRNNDPRGQPVRHISCQKPEHSWTHQTYRH